LQLTQFNRSASTKNENKNNDNSTLKKTNHSAIFVLLVPIHRMRAALAANSYLSAVFASREKSLDIPALFYWN